MKKQYALIDILKFIASIIIVTLHIRSVTVFYCDPYSIKGFFGTFWFTYICRVPVPFFFTVSGYFLFKKINSSDNSRKVVTDYCKRIFILYACWSVLNIVYIIWVRFGFRLPSMGKLLRFVKDVFLQGTFSASWYLAASIIGVIIIYFLTDLTRNNSIALVVSISAYIVCMLGSNYSFMIDFCGEPIKTGFALVSKYYGKIYLSFPYGLIFIAIGKILAENEDNIEARGIWKKVIAAAAIYFVEWIILTYVLKKTTRESVGFASYPLMIYFLVAACLKSDMEYKSIYRTGRQASTIIYCSHYSVAWFLTRLLRKFVVLSALTEYFAILIITLIICMFISYIIIMLSKRWRICGYLY